MPRTSVPYRFFLLSPARVNGKRADLLFNPSAKFDLARKLHHKGAELGEVFAFLSGLYFRGKLAYARHFARPYWNLPGALIITSHHGLVAADRLVTLKDLKTQREVPIDLKNKTYVEALIQSSSELQRQIPARSEVVLLGSIGTNKYAELLMQIFDERLYFPPDFVGRGDMSRGGLMLRCVADNRELPYTPLIGAVRHGKRPPKLEPRRWK